MFVYYYKESYEHIGVLCGKTDSISYSYNEFLTQ